jgi:hypothetical protein
MVLFNSAFTWDLTGQVGLCFGIFTFSEKGVTPRRPARSSCRS